MENNKDLKPTVYGFEAPDYVKIEEFLNYKNSYSKVLNRREYRWDKCYDENVLVNDSFCIPQKYRVSVWMKLTGADVFMAQNSTTYKTASSCDPPSKLLNVILAAFYEKHFFTKWTFNEAKELACNVGRTIRSHIYSDVPRTFPENIYFSNPEDPHTKLHSLERVLKAFAVQFPNVGYCQGMNYIVGILLLVMPDNCSKAEEKAFWLLDALINRSLPPYYSSDMLAVKIDCMVFEELLKDKVPNVYRIIVNNGIDCVLLTSKWFICLFADVLPIETTLRLFDCLFYEGDKILFRACLVLVKLHHKDILKCNEFPDLIIAFQHMCRNSQTLNCHSFLKSMFSLPGSLSKSKINKLRQGCREKLSQAIDAS